MRRVLVYTPDLMFFSQVKGLVETAGWKAQQVKDASLPADGVDGDCLVIDANRDLPRAYAVLDAARPARPWLVMFCHPHQAPETGEEALRRGATEAVRRGALLSRLAQRLGATGSPNLFVGEPDKKPNAP